MIERIEILLLGNFFFVEPSKLPLIIFLLHNPSTTICTGTFAILVHLLIGCEKQARVVQKLDNAIHRINHYPTDSVVCFVNSHLLDSDISAR